MSSPLHHQVDAVLERFATHVGLAVCALDEEGGAQLALDDVFVSLLLDEPVGILWLLSSIGRPAPAAEIYAALLDANLFGAGTDGATLAREPGSHCIVLQQGLPVAGLDLDLFETALRRLTDAAERLRAMLEGAGSPPGLTEDGGGQVSEHAIRG